MFVYLKWNNCALNSSFLLPVICKTTTCNSKCEQVSGPFDNLNGLDSTSSLFLCCSFRCWLCKKRSSSDRGAATKHRLRQCMYYKFVVAVLSNVEIMLITDDEHTADNCLNHVEVYDLA